MAHQTRYQNAALHHMNANPRELDDYAMRMYGQSSKDLELSLLGLTSIAKGHMPSGEPLQHLYREASSKYGWSQDRTRAEISKVIDCSTLPEARIHAYLTANGKQCTPEMLNHAIEMVKHAGKAELEVAIQDRLENSTSNHLLRNEFQGMPTTKRVAEDAQSRRDLRDILRLASGEVTLPQQKSLGYRQGEVIKARHQIADRLERHAAKFNDGSAPSLKDELRMNFEVAAINSASQEVGLGSPIDSAKEDFADSHGHLDMEGYDPLESLNDD